MTDSLSLVADVGGTNTRVALARGTVLAEESVRRYENEGFGALDEVLGRYLSEIGQPALGAACVAMAGPVREGRAVMTNLGWDMEAARLARVTGAARAAILNDLQAQGHALGHVPADRLQVVLPFAPALPEAARLVIGVGTGFNAAPVFSGPGGRIVPPSESGHVTLPVQDEAGLRLSRFLAREHGFASVEDVLSGRGLEAVHGFVRAEAGLPAEEVDGRAVLAAASAGEALAGQTIGIVVRMLGAVAGNLALIQLPFGGIYLIGGMARALSPFFASHGFAEGFADKGRFGPFMANFGVAVVEDDFAALTGCAAYLHP